jgi:DNA processing protein
MLGTAMHETNRSGGSGHRAVRPEELLARLNTAERQNAPEWLYVEGDTSLLGFRPRVSIVGTRQLTPDGGRRAARLARELVAHDVIVVSGLARGTDTVAHETAIAAGGSTVAVLGTPLDVFYPKENEVLQRKITSEHLAVSQFHEGHPVNRTNFPRRNRTMALLSHATVIIEAGEGSGTLSQGWEALRLGRPLFLLRSIKERKDLTWPREMLKYGAQVLTTVDQVLEVLPPRLGSLSELAF